MRTVPFGRPMIGSKEKAAALSVLDGPILVHGPRTKAFEDEFATYTGAPAAVSVSSCTAAMHLVYFSLGLKPGDEVLVPAQTHVATAHAVELMGAKPVFVDAEITTGNIDIDRLESLITPRTRAISVVHYLGVPIDMQRVNSIAQKHHLFVMEDCALSIGARLDGIHTGLLGDAGAFSFYPVKHITTAEGGMITTRDTAFAAKLARQRAFGVDRTASERKVPGVYDVTMLGLNYRMNEIQAAIGSVQVTRIPDFLATRRQNDKVLREALLKTNGIQLLGTTDKRFECSPYCVSVLLDGPLAEKRLEIVAKLNARGVGTSVYYPAPVPHMTYYREKYGYGFETFPVAKRISDASIALPVGPHLNMDDMAYVAECLQTAIEEVA